MNRRSKVLLAGLAAVAVVTPVGIVVAGGDSATGDVGVQAASWHGKAEASKNWQEVPGLIAAAGTNAPIATTISAQMTRGKAKFRVVEFGGGAVEPGPVLFSSKAANSFTWTREGACPGNSYDIEWKRVGKGKAVASKLSAHNVLDQFCL